MQIPFVKRNRGWILGGKPRINWKNPLTNGLLYCYLPGGSGGSIAYNLTGLGCDLVGASSFSTVVTPEGLAGFGDTTNTNMISLSAPVFTPTTAATCLWRGINLGHDLGDKPMIGICSANLGLKSVMADIFSTNDYLLGWTSTDGTFHKSGDFRPSQDNSIISFGGTFQSGGNNLTYVNGLVKASASFGSSNPFKYDSTSRVTIGSNSIITGHSGVNTLMASIWNRALSSNEILSLHNNPYQFLDYPQDDIFAELIGVSTVAASQPHRHGVAG